MGQDDRIGFWIDFWGPKPKDHGAATFDLVDCDEFAEERDVRGAYKADRRWRKLRLTTAIRWLVLQSYYTRSSNRIERVDKQESRGPVVAPVR